MEEAAAATINDTTTRILEMDFISTLKRTGRVTQRYPAPIPMQQLLTEPEQNRVFGRSI